MLLCIYDKVTVEEKDKPLELRLMTSIAIKSPLNSDKGAKVLVLRTALTAVLLLTETVGLGT